MNTCYLSMSYIYKICFLYAVNIIYKFIPSGSLEYEKFGLTISVWVEQETGFIVGVSSLYGEGTIKFFLCSFALPFVVNLVLNEQSLIFR